MSTIDGLPDATPPPDARRSRREPGLIGSKDTGNYGEWEPNGFGSHSVLCVHHGECMVYRTSKGKPTQLCAACVTEGIVSRDRAEGIQHRTAAEDRLEALVAATLEREREWNAVFLALDAEGRVDDAREVLEMMNAERSRIRTIRDGAERLAETDPDASARLAREADPAHLPEVARVVAAAGIRPPAPTRLHPALETVREHRPQDRPAVVHRPDADGLPATALPGDAVPPAGMDRAVPLHHGEEGGLVDPGDLEDCLERWIESLAVP